MSILTRAKQGYTSYHAPLSALVNEEKVCIEEFIVAVAQDGNTFGPWERLDEFVANTLEGARLASVIIDGVRGVRVGLIEHVAEYCESEGVALLYKLDGTWTAWNKECSVRHNGFYPRELLRFGGWK